MEGLIRNAKKGAVWHAEAKSVGGDLTSASVRRGRDQRGRCGCRLRHLRRQCAQMVS
jgi:hypothetical protein